MTSVVLLHGLGGSPTVWDRVLPRITEQSNVVAPRLLCPASIADDAAAVAAELDRPAIVVGHSRGGLVATALAERHPHLVTQLVLVNSPPTTASRRGSVGERLLGLPVLGPLLWRAMPDRVVSRGLATAFAPGFGVPGVFVRDLRATGHGSFVAASRAIDDYLAEQPLLARLASLDLPVEIVLGRQDQRIDLTPYDETQLRVIPVEDSGHTPPWETPEVVVTVVLDALRQAEERP